MNQWPVVITNRCAQRCAEELRHDDQQAARAWLTSQLGNGTVTDSLPSSLGRRRSQSGQFFLVAGLFALPLAGDRDGSAQWIATDCILLPEFKRQNGLAGNADPFALRGTDLLAQLDLTVHVIQRFQQRCGGHPDLTVARRQLEHALAGDLQAVRRAPSWCHTTPSDFFLVAHDEFCLPASRDGSGGKSFGVKTCMHRASDLFELAPKQLVARCSISSSAIGDRSTDDVVRAIGATGHLRWSAPAWVRRTPAGTRFWIELDDRRALPVRWEKDHARPLVVIGYAERIGLFARVAAFVRRLFGN